MCGIAGQFNLLGAPADPSLARSMVATLAHRGPDGHATLVDGEIALGHTRLSIIDLEGGSQPIGNEDGSIQVVFNGEIYNFVELRRELEGFGHRFRTRSDTETIVHAYEQWGDDCVHRLNGMFAFILWNSRTRELFVARDHLGIKPVYYTTAGDTVLVASEIKALLAADRCERDVDLEALAQLFTFRYVPSPKTLFRNICKLPPGHHMTISRSGIHVSRYWKVVPRHDNSRSEGDFIDEYRSLLEDAVRLQLRSDVPLGLFLSSGVDSAALLAIMSQASSRPVQAFTIGFEGGERTNEVDDARDLAAAFGADHRYMTVSPDDYVRYYDRYLLDLEEPVGNETAAAFFFVSKIAAERVKVTLAGQGADEPWAGYGRHLGAKLSGYYARLPEWVTGPAAAIVPRIPGRAERLKRGVSSLSERDTLQRLSKIYSFFTDEMKRELFGPTVTDTARRHPPANALAWVHADVSTHDPLSQILYIDTRTNLPDDLLMVGDKMSMANSLETRVPFLDRRLVEFIETLPPQMKLRNLTAKYIHKRALEKWLPSQVVWRRKKGFANPIDTWFRTGMKGFVDDLLLGTDARIREYFDQAYIRRLIQQDRAGREQHRRHIYLLLSFELWCRTFMNNAARQFQRPTEHSFV
jgi:asparagine synthase (glutamine-hydrolysing)